MLPLIQLKSSIIPQHLGARASLTADLCDSEINQSASPGGLVDTPPQQQWLSEPQRFGVRLQFDPPDTRPPNVRLGSQATVMVYTEEAGRLRPLWKLLIRVRVLISYVY